MTFELLPPPPRHSAGPAPVRAPGSMRRTSSIDVFWPEGRGRNLHLVGRARDIVTPKSHGAPIVCAEDSFEAFLGPDRTIVSIQSAPARPALSRLIGQRGGGGLRQVLAETLPEERNHASPLYLILDDIAGVSLIAGWAWSQWDPNWLEVARAMKGIDPKKPFGGRAGVCIGLAPGSSAFTPKGDRAGAPAPDLRNQDDLEGWHAFPVQEGVSLRRARRIDIALGDVIMIDTAFQDSASTSEGGRRAVHEYRLSVTADPNSLQVLSIEADPRVLPHRECPSATANLGRLLGTPLPELREKVLAELKGVAGCTHLNDALRALADVPVLVSHVTNAAEAHARA